MKLKDTITSFKTYWKQPREGNFVSYREAAAFSVGAMGVKSITALVTFITLNSTCLLIGSVYCLSPRNILLLSVITNVIGVLKTPFVSWMIDNTHTKIGKFRPYILWAGVPAVLSITALAWCVPLGASAGVKTALVGVFINVLNITQPIYNNAYVGISQTITPNSQERASILSVSEFLGNLGPSIVNLVIPLFAGLLFGKEGMLDIRTYRVLFPLFGVISLLLSLVVMKNARERVISTNSLDNKITMAQGLKHLARNRYFWIVTLSKTMDGFKNALTLLLPWICAYQLRNTALQGVIQTVTAIGFTPGIVLAPVLMKKLGIRLTGFSANLLNCVTAIVMLLSFRHGVLFFCVSLLFYNFALGPQYIVQTTIFSNGFDWQQDRENVRIEGFAQNFDIMITTLSGVVATAVFTAIYEHHGLVASPTTGLTDYSVLTNAAVREPIITTVIICVIVASFLAAIPYLFYNLSHKDMEHIRESLESKSQAQ